MFYQRRITEVVPQEGDPTKILICHSGNLGLLVDISWGIEVGDIVTLETAGNSPIGMISKVVGVLNHAGVAKSAAAEPLKGSGSDPMGVQVPPSAPEQKGDAQ
jgi:hypothetical protein